MGKWFKISGGLAALAFVGLVALAAYYWQGLLPADPTSQTEKLFIISPGESLTSVARRLEEAALIRNRYTFIIKTKLAGLDKKIQAGDFELSSQMSAEDILQKLVRGRSDVWITIIPGMRAEEVLTVMKRELAVTSEWKEYFQKKEGKILPDSYLIPRDADKEQAWQIIVANFEQKTQPLLAQAEGQGLTPKEALILASIVERETDKDSADQVAAVLLNRLQADWPLQADATVQYALASQRCQTLDCDWWAVPTGQNVKEVESAYNTYKNTGLPPTPICNPSLQSIEAVIEAPSDSPYWYYLSDRSGKIHFSKTLAEHEEKIVYYHH